MPTGGKITITAAEFGEYVELTISDTGVGVPEEVKDKLFKPLFTTKARGQGFGLAVVKKFVEQLDGEITFDSAPGSGTSFYIRFPKNKPSLNGRVYPQ
jgi:signal transduction histidine kinase